VFLFIVLQTFNESSSVLTNIEKAGIVAILVMAIIYFFRKEQALVKALKECDDKRIEELKSYAESLASLAEKSMVAQNDQKNETKELIQQHEQSVIRKLTEEIDKLQRNK
jgi:hypothetical protein